MSKITHVLKMPPKRLFFFHPADCPTLCLEKDPGVLKHLEQALSDFSKFSQKG